MIVLHTAAFAGRRSAMTVQGQPTVSYTYDTANRLTQINQGTTVVNFAYDAANRRTALTLPNGVTVAYGYDQDSRVTGITYTAGSTALGNLTYGYDAASRHTQMGGSFAQTNLPQPVTAASYDAGNELLQWGSTNLAYDSNGNLVNDGLNQYTWNARNQLVSMSGSTTAAFQYDAYGRRSSKTVGSVSTGFLYDVINVAQELSGTTPTANVLSGGVDEIFMRADSTGAYSFLADGLGSTLALADATGALQTQYTYEPFGNTTIAGSSSNSLQYTGRENDGTGLYYYRVRYYNPAIGRFISEDPIGFLGGINEYVYVDDDPMDFIDPFGLDKNPPWYKNPCITSALGEATLSIGVDAIGLIPEGGGAKTVARNVGNWFGYRGIVADNFGKAAIQQAQHGADTFSLTQGLGGQDWISTGLSAAGFIPVLGQAAAGASIIYDGYKTWKKIQACP